MQCQQGFFGTAVDEVRQLAIGVTSEVCELPKLAGELIEAVNRNR